MAQAEWWINPEIFADLQMEYFNNVTLLPWRVKSHQLDCFLNRLFRLTRNKTSKLCISISGTVVFPSQKVNYTKSFPYRGVIMPQNWHHVDEFYQYEMSSKIKEIYICIFLLCEDICVKIYIKGGLCTYMHVCVCAWPYKFPIIHIFIHLITYILFISHVIAV